MIKRIVKSTKLEYTGKMIKLPEDLNKKIQDFWSSAVKKTPTLYNGEDYGVEDVKETENEIIMKVAKTNYSHYLYDERVGISNEKYRCITPWGGILLLTNDNYWVFGQASEETSFPNETIFTPSSTYLSSSLSRVKTSSSCPIISKQSFLQIIQQEKAPPPRPKIKNNNATNQAFALVAFATFAIFFCLLFETLTSSMSIVMFAFALFDVLVAVFLVAIFHQPF